MSDTMRPAAGERARWRDLLRLSWREWQHHPGRHAVALLAVALGVALAFSVHLINRSALAEFAAAVRTTSGEPDLALQAQADAFDDALFDRVAQAGPHVGWQVDLRRIVDFGLDGPCQQHRSHAHPSPSPCSDRPGRADASR